MKPINDLETQVRKRLALGSLTAAESAFLRTLIHRVATGHGLSEKEGRWLSHLIDSAPSKPIITKYPKERE